MPAAGKVNRALAWVGAASAVVAFLDFSASFIIFRFWVGPKGYGVATPAIALFMILDLATDLGMASSVIQKDEHTPEIISTVFWLNLASSFVLTGLVWAGSPALAKYLHGNFTARDMLRAYTAKIVFQNFYFIPAAMMRRELRFRELAIVRMLANLAEFGGKIGFAAGGFGAWCFVLGPLCRVVVTCIGIQYFHPWRPKAVLRLKEAAEYVRFGIKTSASQILFYTYTNVDYLVVGHYFDATANGLYKQAYELVLEPVKMMSQVVSDVAFPVFARLRTKPTKVIQQFIEFTRQNLVVVGPFLMIILLAAPEILRILGPQWVPASNAARILCIVGTLRAMSFVVPPLLDGIGYPALTLVYNVVAAIILPALYVVFAKSFGPSHGYISVAWAWAVGYPVAFAALAWMALNRIGLSGIAYVRSIIVIPVCIAGGSAAGVVARLATTHVEWWVRLLVVAASSFGVLGLLLAYVAGISPRTILRSLKKPVEEEQQA